MDVYIGGCGFEIIDIRRTYCAYVAGVPRDEMRKLGYKTVLTSTASDEFAQHFYIKLGYTSIGGFLPIGKTFEIILSRKL